MKKIFRRIQNQISSSSGEILRRELNQIKKRNEGPFESNILGPTLHIACGATFPYLYGEIIEREIYKFETGNEDGLIIDGGANIGLATIFFKQLYPRASVIAVEPDPVNFSLLEKNVASFGLDAVETLPIAIAAKSGMTSFATDAESTKGKLGESGEIEVVTATLSDIVQDRKVEFLKLDIEGAEHDVIKGSENVLSRVERLFIELHGHRDEPQRVHETLAALTDNGFRVHIESGGPYVRHPFLGPMDHHGLDVLLNVFAFRP